MIPETEYERQRAERAETSLAKQADEIEALRCQLAECQQRVKEAEQEIQNRNEAIEGYFKEWRKWAKERDRLLGKEGEKCRECGRHYLLVWETDDLLWQKIVGHPGGLLCPDCFDKECREQGFFLNWQALTGGSEGE